MSARRAGPPPGGAPDLWLLLVAALAALGGGLAAADIVHAKIVVTLVVSLVVAAIAIFAISRWPSPRLELPAAEQRPQQLPGRPAGPPGSRPAPGPTARPGAQQVPPGPDLDGEAGTNAVVQLLPAQPEQAGSDWWQKGPVPPPQPSAGARRAPAPDLSAYLAFTQIAQCPNCGAFGLEIGQIRGGWGFRCESCAYTWAWRPGTPWPTTRVAPGRRRESRPPS
jgi:hypothetical protein